MKITSSNEDVRLYPGDRVEVSVSHEVKIGRESSWVRYQATSTMQENEKDWQAAGRVVSHVNDEVMKAINTVVKTVQESER